MLNHGKDHRHSGKRPQKDPAARLTELLRVKQTIPYHENVPDKEFPYITWSIYGAPETNELFVKLTNGATTFVEVTQSELLFPLMTDRVFGMDVQDHAVASRLADHMWKKHKAALKDSPSAQKPLP